MLGLRELCEADILARKLEITESLEFRLKILELFGKIFLAVGAEHSAFNAYKEIHKIKSRLISKEQSHASLSRIYLKLGSLAHKLNRPEEAIDYFYKGLKNRSTAALNQ